MKIRDIFWVLLTVFTLGCGGSIREVHGVRFALNESESRAAGELERDQRSSAEPTCPYWTRARNGIGTTYRQLARWVEAKAGEACGATMGAALGSSPSLNGSSSLSANSPTQPQFYCESFYGPGYEGANDALSQCFQTQQDCDMFSGAYLGHVSCRARSSAYCVFMSSTGDPKKYSCFSTVAACSGAARLGKDARCDEYQSFPTSSVVAYENGQDPSDCNSYLQLGLLGVPQYPRSEDDWTQETVQIVTNACASFESTHSLLWAGVHFLPTNVVDHPNEACVAPYLNKGRADCAVALPIAGRVRARFDAVQNRQQALDAQKEAEHQRWLQTPEGRRDTCIKGCDRWCAVDCNEAFDQATCIQVCQNNVQLCKNRCP